MKNLSLIALCLGLTSTMHAQLNGDGYYRIQNAETGRYISITNNKVDSQSKSVWQVVNSGAHIYALKTSKSFSSVISDPGTIIYIAKEADGYILRGQGMDTKLLTNGRYLKIYDSRTKAGAYWLYASESGTAVYLKDKEDVSDKSKNTGYVLVSTSHSEAEIDWNLLPIDQTEQYLGITPELSIGEKYYTTLYAGFPFSLSEGMKAYYVKNVDNALAEMIEIEEEIIPAGTPIILECLSQDPADNKLTLLTNQPSAIQDNLLKGQYFSYVMRDRQGNEVNTDLANQLRNVISYDAETMRVLGEVNGKLGFIKTDDLIYLPANKAYLPVSSTSIDNIELVDSDTFATNIGVIMNTSKPMLQQGVFTLTGVRLRSDSSIDGLPNGLYLINGKKVVIK